MTARFLAACAGLFAVTLCLIAFVPSTALADKPVAVETYNVVPAVPCDGYAANGIAYAFTLGGAPSLDCGVGGFGPGLTNHITPPNIEGNAQGVLHLTFDVPTTVFGFGVAQSTPVSPQPQSVIVHLNRPGAGLLREEIFLTTTSDPFFVGGRYDYSGPAVKTVTIQFSGPYSRFVVDNVTYFRPPGQAKK